MEKSITKFSLTLPNGATVEFEGDKEYVQRNLSDIEKLISLVKDFPVEQKGKTEKRESLQGIDNKQLTIGDVEGVGAGKREDLTSVETTEFLEGVYKGKSAQVKVAVFVYYLSQKKGWKEVYTDDLKHCFSLGNTPVPDVEKAVYNCITRKHFLRRGRDGNISITREGINFIEYSNGDSSEKRKVGKSRKHTSSSSSGKSSPKLIIRGDLKLFGDNEQKSFKEFAEERKPITNLDRIAIAAYYLIHILECDSFDEHDVYTCYDHMGWKSPIFLRNNIINHKREKGFYSINEKKFVATLRLKNYVEHELVARHSVN